MVESSLFGAATSLTTTDHNATAELVSLDLAIRVGIVATYRNTGNILEALALTSQRVGPCLTPLVRHVF